MYERGGEMPDETAEHTVYAETESETDRKCPSCGGTMEYDPNTGKLLCPYCGFTKEIAKPEDPAQPFEAEEHAFDAAEGATSTDWGTRTKVIRCKSCGAEVIYDANAIADVCPYCGATLVTEAGDSQQNILVPGGVVPFSLDQKAAAVNFRTWIHGRFFCPKLAKESAKPDRFQGLYIPYWTFDARTETDYTGEYGKNRAERTRDGKTEQHTDWYPTSGRLYKNYDDVLVCGSERYDSSILGGVSAFDTGKTVPYAPQYLAGFAAERYTVKLKDAWESGKQSIAQDLRYEADRKVRQENQADAVRSLDLHTAYSGITYKYLLLPIWISSFMYNGKIYSFMINGQSGTVSGRTPVSWIKVLITAAAVIAAAVIIYRLL